MRGIIKSEIIKLRHSKVLVIAMLVPIFFVLIGLFNVLRYKELFTSKGQNIWDSIYTQSALFYGLFILQILTAVVMAVLAYIENDRDCWKRLLSLPVKRERIYLSKFLVGCMLIFINIIAFTVTVAVGGMIIAPGTSIPAVVFKNPLMAFLALMPVMAIQYYLSIKFKHIGIPLTVGITFSLPAVLAANTNLWIIFPWTYASRAIASETNMSYNGSNLVMYAAAVLITVLVIWFGAKEFSKRQVV